MRPLLVPASAAALIAALLSGRAVGQERPAGEPRPDGPPAAGRDGPTTRPLGRGFGGPMRQDRPLVKQFDKDGDGRLTADERRAARDAAKAGQRRGPFGLGGAGAPGGPGGPPPDVVDRPGGATPSGDAGAGPVTRPLEGDPDARGPRDGGGFGRPFGPGGPGGGGGGPFGGRSREPAKPGPRVSPADVSNHPDAPLYDPGVLRTLFLDFDAPDWEAELADFHGTDVEIPATLTVDGRTYRGVGVSFRGASSFMGVPAGYKRSLNVSVDHANPDQRLYGYKSLNLLNSNDDPTFLRTVLYTHVAREYIPAPKANLVKVVINGESWGVYTNAQQFNKDFVREWFPDPAAKADKPKGEKKSKKAAAAKAIADARDDAKKDADARKSDKAKIARWKVPGSPGGGGSLAYLGEDVAAYKRLYEIKSDDVDESWRALVELCRTLNQTPPEKLEAALAPMLDVDGALWFLALDCTFVNADGYWTRGSDYSLLRDRDGRFHVIPHDANETFSAGGGPGGGGRGMRGGRDGRPGEGGRPGANRRDANRADAGRGGPDARRDDARPTDTRPADARPNDAAGPDAPRDGLRGDRRDGEGPGGGRGGREGSRDGGGLGGFGGFFGRMGGPGGGGGVTLDPLVGLDDASKPLRSRLLAVPALRARYLAHVRTLAEKWLDWDTLGPVVGRYRALIEKEVEADTRKLDSTDAFRQGTSDAAGAAPAPPADAPRGPGDAGRADPARGGDAPANADRGRPPGRPRLSLRQFADQRRAYLLAHPEVKGAAAAK